MSRRPSSRMISMDRERALVIYSDYFGDYPYHGMRLYARRTAGRCPTAAVKVTVGQCGSGRLRRSRAGQPESR
jgi:hypothetical protein